MKNTWSKILAILLALALLLSCCACQKQDEGSKEEEKQEEQQNPSGGETDEKSEQGQDDAKDEDVVSDDQKLVYAYQEFSKFLESAQPFWGEMYLVLGYDSCDPYKYEYKGMLDNENYIFGLKDTSQVKDQSEELGLFYVDMGENPDIWCHDYLVAELGLSTDLVWTNGALVPNVTAFEDGSENQKMVQVALSEIEAEIASSGTRNSDYYKVFNGFVNEKNQCLGLTCDWFIEDKDGAYATYILKDYQDCMFVRLGYHGSSSASLFSCIVRQNGDAWELVKVTQSFN